MEYIWGIETTEKGIRSLSDGYRYILTMTTLSFIFPLQRQMEESTPDPLKLLQRTNRWVGSSLLASSCQHVDLKQGIKTEVLGAAVPGCSSSLLSWWKSASVRLRDADILRTGEILYLGSINPQLISLKCFWLLSTNQSFEKRACTCRNHGGKPPAPPCTRASGESLQRN